ncbi:FG-GAP-like repeat-containing protein [Streptomyces sp. bgisy031]|uniref:FG-GAP-like repeat-containing protein n=1 Tax=Streptomyces sp. bgisy031 TaxID=3413772 RepID=UPI003D72DCEA
MSNFHRKGLHLASTLLAAGLTLSAVPQAMADDNSILTLTDAQADKLAQHAQVDVYGDAAASDQDGTDTGTDSGTDGSTTGTAPWKLTQRSAMEGVQGMAATTPVGGTASDYFTLHSLGTIQRRTADGKQLWMRDTMSLYKDWQVTPTRWYQQEPYPARIVMGYNAVGPFSTASDEGYDTGDLTGDGVDDVVFTADVGNKSYRPFTSPGSSLPTGTFVTVLDGKSGKTLWSKLYAGAYQIKLVGKTLVVADSPFLNRFNAPTDSRTKLNGIRFSYADGKLTPADTWSYDAVAYTGTAWSSLEPVGDGLLAASWDRDRRSTADLTPSGHTLVIDTKDGSVKWSVTGRLYSRQLHLDAARGRLVALDQSDPAEGVKYEVASYALADGARTTLDTRINALPLTMTMGDLQGNTKPEYVVSESTVDNSQALTMNSNTVRALNGDNAALLWARTVKPDAATTTDVGSAWGLKVAGRSVVASYMDDQGSKTADNYGAVHYARLAVLAGNNGAVKWEKRGIVGSLLWAQPMYYDNGWHLRTVDTNQNIRVYNAGSGKQESLQPLQAMLSSAVLTDVNGDGKKDVVAGGVSNGLYAFDGPSLVSGTPKRLWSATLPGQIHQIVKADVTGDGRDELVVAADSATVIVDAATGKVLTTIDGGGQFVRNAVAADLNGDGKAEVAVATDKVRAYKADGTLLWTYAAPAPVDSAVFSDLSTGDGKVYAQYQPRGVNGLAAAGAPVGEVALKGKDGSVSWSATPKPGDGTDGKLHGTTVRAGTFASPAIPYADGHAVVYTYYSTRVDNGPYNGQPALMVQIRDGRTGELLHEALTKGAPLSWFTGPQGLVKTTIASVQTFGADGQDSAIYTIPDTRTAALAKGPGGSSVLVTAGTQFLYTYDPSVTAGKDYPMPGPGTTLLGAQEFVTGDLDGDGTDEIVSLNADDYGADRTAALIGRSDYQSFSAVRQLVTLSIDPS